ncbi:MAG TPA: type II toxin-antitoxin system VapC family toxin [Chthonomonadaceae bacterium]|nr:type II toxin-antitoxin system VapC family toxin [Chthonomonadaceae bacterium]
MPPLYILDTNILVYLVRRDETGQRIQALYDPLMIEPRPILSVVTAGELRSLAYQFHWGKSKIDQVGFLLNYFKCISLDDEDIIEAYAVLDAHTESIGRSMGKNDLWIAATAKIMGATLLTADRDFDHLDPLFITRIWIDPELETRS